VKIEYIAIFTAIIGFIISSIMVIIGYFSGILFGEILPVLFIPLSISLVSSIFLASNNLRSALIAIGGSTVLGTLLLIFLPWAFIPRESLAWIELLFIEGLVILLSSGSFEHDILIEMVGRFIIIGRFLKNVSSALILSWFLVKIGFMTEMVTVFGSTDMMLFYGFLFYIAGSAISWINTQNIESMIKGVMWGALFATIVVLILGFFLSIFGLTGSQWAGIQARLLSAAVLLFFSAAIASIISPSALRFEPILEIKPDQIRQDEIYINIVPNNLEISQNAKLNLKEGSLVVPLKTKKGYVGVYLLGDIEYEAKADILSIVGHASDVLLFSNKHDIWDVFKQDFELKVANYTDLKFVGFENKSEIFKLVREKISEIRQETSKGKFSWVKGPVFDIRETEKGEYVRVGPIFVAETKNGNIVKVGPITVVEGGGGSWGLGREIKRTKVRITAILTDVLRGKVTISAFETGYELKFGDIKITYTENEVTFRKGVNKITIGKNGKKIIKMGKIRLIIIPDTYASLTKDGEQIKAYYSKYIKITRGGDMRKVEDPVIANKVFEKLEKSADRIISQMTRVDELSEVKGLVEYLDGIIGKED